MIDVMLRAKHWLLHGGSFSLRPYEVACIQAWKSTLSNGAAGLLKEQLKRLNIFHRYERGRLVCFYDIRDKSCTTWPKEILFPCNVDEAAVSRLQLSRKAGCRSSVKVDVKLYRGRFFGLEFDNSPKSIGNDAQIVSITPLIDPMQPVGRFSQSIGLSEIPHGLRDRLKQLSARELRLPLPPSERDELILSIDAKLPDDYVAFVSASEGGIIESWRVHGLSDMRKVAHATGDYYLLAEAGDGRAIGVARGSRNGELQLITPEEDTVKPAGSALLAVIGGQVS